MLLQTVLRVAVLALVLSPSLAQARILTIHELAADPKRYDGQYVTVRAVADFDGMSTSMLLHSKEVYLRYAKGRLTNAQAERACITVINNGLLFHSMREKKWLQGRTVTVSGVFEANMFGDGGEGIHRSGCGVNYRQLELDKVHRID